MRSESRSVLKRDLPIALLMVGAGLFSGGVSAVRTVPVVGVAIAVLMAVSAAAGEHDLVPGLFPEVASMLAFVVVVVVGIGFIVLLPTPIDVTSAAALTGAGVGYAVYRLLFGVVFDVPEYRLERERDDEDDEFAP
jgi:hypothetical protein